MVNTVARSDASRRPSHTRSGHGLLGARERVAAVHGQLTAGPGPGPVYRLTATLPLPDLRSDAPAVGGSR